MVGDVFPVSRLVLQNLVQVLEPALRSSGKGAAVAGIGRRLPAGVHVKLSGTEQL